ncbi:MAG: tRNA (adenosine(37)-N6)-threonylcarbamoyltransferase complex dimerization subunit type 1 TsaB [Deltaproteobacteria bacterium]|jgi:tRNA threonylcarbamoyladenosine biosynthesis protein TsaB|nr:tRNA (adenosine(37)-N6)-threonylcarbamoyltransferase complex dimerization subunit type 1 TsaB [Deltaproteobacteria bacterium]MBT4088168.1 tRNA (adenosine(37)-N6)-threonylcarbamoyltransferase complex dimerization subunit type 1 TsaB [Deltaproteobacteria bacterium]MBT4268077.1 tRNA (adenosine(37)-N6)-threonylcarbamoyltransferase complex dimerization subunit type 1 TsaB [Deltaproteobacteria bacterium]MBT4641455.1 tRNA (adenosine(37)-N6)-threonylcarbamoyltransferase complex dimerization subunit t
MLLKEQCILGIEGSGFSVSIGLMDQGVPKGNLFLNTGAPGSESLLSGIDQLLRMLNVQKDALDGVCVTLGPGSFTSLRICLSTAEALGLGLNIPVYGIDSLGLIAASVPFYASTIKVIQNAYKGEFYSASYDTSRGKAVSLSDLSLIKPDLFYEQLKKGELILGNGVGKLMDLQLDLQAKGVVWNQDFQRIASGIGVIEHFLESEVRDSSAIPLEPIYIRLPEAELNYEKQFGKE